MAELKHERRTNPLTGHEETRIKGSTLWRIRGKKHAPGELVAPLQAEEGCCVPETEFIAFSGTGLQSYAGLTRMPKRIEFYAAQEGGSADVVARFSEGSYEDINQRQAANATFRDSNGGEAESVQNRCFIFLDRATNIDRKIDVEFVSCDNNGGGDYGFTVDQHACSVTAIVEVKIYY